MGAVDAPAWLLSAFVRSVVGIGATADRSTIEAEGTDLLERWSTPDRHYHGITHLVNVLERVDMLAQETHHPDLVRVASWYHGVVFDASMLKQYKRAAGENKPESANFARAHLLELGVPPKVAERVHDLIMNLIRHDADPADMDAQALCDSDLGTLAVDPQRYRTYRQKVRTEFAHIPVRDYVESRIAIATKLLARRHIYRSPLAGEWEQSARQNLEAELAQLRVELAALPEREEGDAAIPEVPVLKPLRISESAADIAFADKEKQRSNVERFGRDVSLDESRFAGAEILAPSQPVPPVRPGASPTGDAAEVVGMPYEDRPTETHPIQTRHGSGIEQEPTAPTDLPLRGASAPETASAAEAEAKRLGIQERAKRLREAVSTSADDDGEATGSLFRPIDR